jgi:Putative MetA-pathway of phenol degradation
VRPFTIRFSGEFYIARALRLNPLWRIIILKRTSILALSILISAIFHTSVSAQVAESRRPDASTEVSAAIVEKTDRDGDISENESKAAKRDLSGQKYRLLQSNGLLVETAYHQEAGELQHTFAMSRTNRRNWASVFTEEIPLGSGKHQLSFSLPAQLVRNDAESFRGIGDAKFEYSYFLYGNNSSKVTFAPGFGVSLPTGNYRKELGAGASGVSAKLPVSVMLGKRFAANSTFEMSYTRRAKNAEGEKANLVGYEFGQSFVWFAKPKLNLLVEAVWERSPEVIGDNLKKYERELYVSPGVRWAHTFKNGLMIIPSIGVPIGVGASRGTHGIFFSIGFEHSIGKEK